MFAVSGGCGGHGLLPGLQGIAMGRAGGQARVRNNYMILGMI